LVIEKEAKMGHAVPSTEHGNKIDSSRSFPEAGIHKIFT
jgi:hypothetical protein